MTSSRNSDVGDVFAGCFLSVAGSLVGSMIGTVAIVLRMLPAADGGGSAAAAAAWAAAAALVEHDAALGGAARSAVAGFAVDAFSLVARLRPPRWQFALVAVTRRTSRSACRRYRRSELAPRSRHGYSPRAKARFEPDTEKTGEDR